MVRALLVAALIFLALVTVALVIANRDEPQSACQSEVCLYVRRAPGFGEHLASAHETAYVAPDREFESRGQDVWSALADCESGAWLDGGAAFVWYSADWDVDGGTFEGGLQFHPDTWDWLRPESWPDSAADATRAQQIVVAERVRERQGFDAWPTCARLIGLLP